MHRLTLITVAFVALLPAEWAAGQVLSSKRGFADTGANYGNLQATGAGWYYTWGPGAGFPGNFDANHIPMIWGGTPSQNTLNDIKNNPNVEWVLGFNEPERPDQANMTVSQAISSWTTISNGFAGTGIKLVSPAVADTGGPDGGQAWLANFMSQAASANLTVDAVAFHWYGVSTPHDPVGAANSFLGRVDSYHNQYNKPVFITEFALHDWGGNFSDAEMIEANRQFLDIVIPGLENRDHVAGYSWYHWFSDAPLYSGNPPTPTPMAHRYVGAIRRGQVENLSGQNLGEHVAYLAGGELTHSGGSAGTVQYINALENVSTISGAANWAIASDDWVRIQPGATLRKAGPNEITIDGLTTNNGVLTVSEGALNIAGPVVGNGNAAVTGGVLKLTGTASLSRTPLIDVRATGTFDVSGVNSPLNVPNDHVLNVDSGGVVLGNVFAGNGSTVSGGGTFKANLTAQSGALIRVGGLGVATNHWLIDDFETYNPGKLRDGVSGGAWTGVFDGTANAQVVSSSGNESLEYYGTASEWRGARAGLNSSFAAGDFSLADGDAATYFFRVQRQGTATIDGIFGLTDLDSIGTGAPWQELSITLALFKDSDAAPRDPTVLRAYDNDGSGDVVILNNVASNEWVNVWLAVDNDAKTFEVATSTGASDGTLFPNTFEFGRSTAIGADLVTFAGAEFRSPSNPANASVRIDDLYYLPGVDLTNPLSPTPSYISQTMTVEGDFTLGSGATLELDVFSSAVLDRLAVTGNLTAEGSLHVLLDADASALQVGDLFDILDFGSFSGSFIAMDLPNLDPGLAWDVSALSTSGELQVVLDVDLDNDGDVDGNDFLMIQRLDPALLPAWEASFGNQLVGANLRNAAVPEPAALTLLLSAASAIGCLRVKRRSESVIVTTA